MNERQEEIMADIDEEIAPEKMGQESAVEWLEEIASAVSSRIQSIKQDIRNG